MYHIVAIRPQEQHATQVHRILAHEVLRDFVCTDLFKDEVLHQQLHRYHNGSVLLMIVFNNETSRDHYLYHDTHLKIVERLKPLLDKVQVSDFYAPGLEHYDSVYHIEMLQARNIERCLEANVFIHTQDSPRSEDLHFFSSQTTEESEENDFIPVVTKPKTSLLMGGLYPNISKEVFQHGNLALFLSFDSLEERQNYLRGESYQQVVKAIDSAADQALTVRCQWHADPEKPAAQSTLLTPTTLGFHS